MQDSEHKGLILRVRFLEQNIVPFLTTEGKVLSAIPIFKFLEHEVWDEKS